MRNESRDVHLLEVDAVYKARNPLCCPELYDEMNLTKMAAPDDVMGAGAVVPQVRLKNGGALASSPLNTCDVKVRIIENKAKLKSIYSVLRTA